jgi:hypothetical protein
MAVKSLQIHSAALEELKSAVAWYHERNQTAAVNFIGTLMGLEPAPNEGSKIDLLGQTQLAH